MGVDHSHSPIWKGVNPWIRVYPKTLNYTIHYSYGQGLFYKTKQVLSKLVSLKIFSAVTDSLGKTELVAVNFLKFSKIDLPISKM